jgi:predicted phage terminase large subunit-like protein
VFLPLEDPLGRKAGEALWPAKYNREALLTIQANIGAHEFGSLYQQVPHPETGGFFQETDFEVVDQAPEKMQWYRYVDLALGESKTSDFNATVGMAMDEKTGDVFLRDMLRVHELTEFQAQLVDWMLSPGEKATIWGIEDVSFQALVMRELLTDRRLVNLAIGPVTPEGDKVSRARPLQTRARQGKVKLVRGSWTREFINEALGFPGGKHDDQVDTASGGLAMIADGILPHGAELAAFL